MADKSGAALDAPFYLSRCLDMISRASAVNYEFPSQVAPTIKLQYPDPKVGLIVGLLIWRIQ